MRSIKLLLAFLLVSAAPAIAQEPFVVLEYRSGNSATVDASTHRVRRGETLAMIVAKYYGRSAVFCGKGAGWRGRLSKVVTRISSTVMFRFRRATRTTKANSPKARTAKTNNIACQKYGIARIALKTAGSVILRDVLWKKYCATQRLQQKSFVRLPGNRG